MSKLNKGIRFLLRAIDIFGKYVSVVLLKEKKIVNAFQCILANSKRKPTKRMVDNGSEFYKSFFKKWHWHRRRHRHVFSIQWRTERSAVAESFIRTLKSKMYK